ncbi:hypothetical protein IFR04_007081 [Cadophora malorum]|uniref:DUF2423 domain-containing protein n=1 Tax=Cadophora malorum TaxID=108018 RepID=A0A8H7W6V6_9HELO|nr:hypothetical protein IFR04_007081 [Cadophora malorum]
MAKGARASTKKANNVKLKSKVFGPVETDRTARLSAKLLALAAQPKPKAAEKDVDMEAEDVATEDEVVPATEIKQIKQTEAMEVDSKKASSKSGKGEIKRRVSKRRSAIVFPKYNERSKVKKTKGKK